MLSTLLSTLTIAATTLLARRLFNHNTALLVALLISFNPFEVWYAQDARPYALWTTLSTISTCSFTAMLTTNPSRRRSWLTYATFATASLLSFYLHAFYLLGQNLIALTTHFRQPRWLARWLLTQTIICSIALAWILSANLQSSGYQPTASIPDIPAAITTLILNDTFPYYSSFLATVLCLIIIVALAALWLRNRRSTQLLAYLIITPLIALTTLTLISHKGYFRPRYIAAISPLLMLALAAATTRLAYKRKPHILSTAPALLLLLSLISLINYHFNPQYAKAPLWRDLMAILHGNTANHDLIIQNYPDPAFTYYYHDTTPVIILPSRENPPPTETVAATQTATTRPDYIWFLPTPSNYWDRDQVVANWLQQNMQSISEQRIGVLHLYQYGQWVPSEAAIRNPITITFTNTARIDGYRLTPNTHILRPGMTLIIEVFWTPINQTTNPLTIFTHLLATTTGTPQLIAQDDHPPQQTRLSTKTWPIDQTFRDIYTIHIPTNLPDGSYPISVGLYDPTTSIRLPPITNTPQPEPNAATLTTITIAHP